MKTLHRIRRKTVLASAVAATLGIAAPLQEAFAAELVFSYDGYFRMLDPNGAALANSSMPKGTNQYETPITGTLVYDDTAGTGTMTINSFSFFGNPIPAQATGVTFESIGGGELLVNMLFNWGGNNGIPVSVVMDANGFLGALATTSVGGTIGTTAAGSVRGAADGTYVGVTGTHITSGYLDLGAVPIATTTWNTTPACTPGGGNSGACMNVNPSGSLPLVADTAVNTNDYNAVFMGGDGSNALGIGSSPMLAGPFENFNANFDITSLVMLSDGTGATFTAPADPNASASNVLPGATVPVDIGTVIDEAAPATDATCNVTVQYSDDGGATWIADSGGVNTVNVTLTGAVTTVTIDWRATTASGAPVTCSTNSTAFGSQTVTVTIADATDPTFDTFPVDFSVSLQSTAETITFEGPTSGRGSVTASDDVTAAPTIEWSLDGLNWTEETAGADESSTSFGAGANIVYWRATDDSGNETIRQQTVTVNLPAGIFGQPCTVDTAGLLNAEIGDRQLEGVFVMLDPTGSRVGDIDETVTGTINTATICANESCTDSGAALATTQAFFGNLWNTETIRLFGEGTYTFDACPGAIDAGGTTADGSIKCDGDDDLIMTVGPNQIGGHMLFNWSVNRKIDVAVVWSYSCGGAELVSTDPDGDGIIGTKMVDGPFKGFNATFDLRTADGQTPITTGGYSSTIPVVNNTVDGASPLLLGPGTVGTTLGGVVFSADDLSGMGAADDTRVVSSCVGGCFDFSVSGRTPGEPIQVVLPLSQPIPWYSLYRKYNPATNSWGDFVSNGTDSVMTAPLNTDGRCPEPGAGDYSSYSSGLLAGMLRPDDQCVQLTITDNGPNDDDAAAGVIADPGGVGVTSAPATPEAATSSGGGCTVSATSATQRVDLWLAAGLLGALGLRRKMRQ